MTAKAGEHRTIRLPEELIGRIDSVRGTTPRERWIRALLYRVTGELLVGRGTIVLEFGPDGALLDGPRQVQPIQYDFASQPVVDGKVAVLDDVDALAVIAAEALRDRVDASRENPDGPHEDEAELIAQAERLESNARAAAAGPTLPPRPYGTTTSLPAIVDRMPKAARTAPTPDEIAVVARANRDATTTAPRLRLKRPEAKP